METEDRLRRALADRYAIEAAIDSGGMAMVYRARDLKHDRTVAVKVLRPDLAEAIGADRFLREIRTTANLSHPHILPLHDSGEADGLLYYVMPFVEGESLADRLDREGQLPIEDGVQIAREVADALAYAHEKGVIHRDVKPANIMLERGHALLADFGIAQARAGAEVTKLTESGMSLGTPSYMSPEQVTGDGELDGRADQYALGCVLYEMLAGRPPFTGEGIETVLRQHLAADPPRITGSRATVPKGVASALHRALAKSPADRFRTMGEFEKALAGATLPFFARIPMGRARAVVFTTTVILGLVVVAVIASVWSPGGPELQDDLVLVIPFDNRTGVDSLDAYAEYVTMAVGLGLEQTGLVRLVPRKEAADWWEATEERRLQDPEFDSRRAIAERFGAGILVEGSVLMGSDSLRLSGGFREARGSGEVIRQFLTGVPRRDPDEGTGVGSLADALSAALAVHLDPAWGGDDGTGRHFATPLSYAGFFEFRACGEAYLRWELEEALRHCEAASSLDPTYVPAKVSQAVLHRLLVRPAVADSILTEVEESGLELLPGDRAQVLWLRATLDGNREGAYQAMKDGSYGDPMSVSVWVTESLRTNRPGEALQVLESMDPDTGLVPQMPQHWGDLGQAWHAQGDHRRELREIREGRRRHPDDSDLLLAEIRARAALRQVREVDGLLDEAVNRGANPAEALRIAALELRAHKEGEASFAVGERELVFLQRDSTESDPSWDLLRALYLLERWEEAEAMVEGLLNSDPSLPFERYFLGYQGALAARAGRAGEARAVDARLAAMAATEIPYDLGKATYQRARIAALLDEKDRAVSLLRQAYEEGWQYSLELHTEMDFEGLKGFGPFEAFLRPKG